jgi:hypothetical protein
VQEAGTDLDPVWSPVAATVGEAAAVGLRAVAVGPVQRADRQRPGHGSRVAGEEAPCVFEQAVRARRSWPVDGPANPSRTHHDVTVHLPPGRLQFLRMRCDCQWVAKVLPLLSFPSK